VRGAVESAARRVKVRSRMRWAGTPRCMSAATR
jgi:hypothetical protein